MELYLVAVNDPPTIEGRAGLDDGQTARVADDLRVVIVDDGRGNQIGARWEVNLCVIYV
jgi:hypothetical protein